tara:strand:- start:8825 stop:9250 length:426 start_codon:yes stop_codon:yes gene_type:complete
MDELILQLLLGGGTRTAAADPLVGLLQRLSAKPEPTPIADAGGVQESKPATTSPSSDVVLSGLGPPINQSIVNLLRAAPSDVTSRLAVRNPAAQLVSIAPEPIDDIDPRDMVTMMAVGAVVVMAMVMMMQAMTQTMLLRRL